MLSLFRSLIAVLMLVLSSTGWSETQYSKLETIVIHPKRSAPAVAVSRNQTVLSSQLMARVEEIYADVSQPVQQGDLLIRLDCTDYQLALDMAKADHQAARASLDLARKQKQRSDKLLSTNVTSQDAADTAEANVIANQAKLERASLAVRKAKIDVSRCNLKAPFDGLVTQRMINTGQLATVGSPLISITDTTHLELSAQVPHNQVEQLGKAGSLVFYSDRRYPVALARVGGVVNPQTRLQEVRLSFTTAKPKPGVAGQLIWHDPKPFIPGRYITSRDSRLGVFIRLNDQLQFHPLPEAKPGLAAATDLPLDTQIATDSLGDLESGASLSTP